ncbi:MAG: YlxR family protein [Oscillospiraceae bacterium]|jgi:predicted RNA-binding protein YlxR (DUF448 family)|nr:YlxR family protein [Oscillospiraceae bacterium]
MPTPQKAVKKSPKRHCIACRTERDKKELIRVVKKPDGSVIIDEHGKASGRGAYICRDKKCLDKAAKSRAFSRQLKLEAPFPDEILAQLAELVAPSAENAQ